METAAKRLLALIGAVFRGRLEQSLELEHLELALFHLEVAGELDQLLLLAFDLLLTVQLLLFEFVLQQLNLLKLSVKLELQVVDNVAQVPRLIL